MTDIYGCKPAMKTGVVKAGQRRLSNPAGGIPTVNGQQAGDDGRRGGKTGNLEPGMTRLTPIHAGAVLNYGFDAFVGFCALEAGAACGDVGGLTSLQPSRI